MKDGPRSHVWIVGLVCAVVLLGLANLAPHFDLGTLRSFLTPAARNSPLPAASPAAASRNAGRPSDISQSPTTASVKIAPDRAAQAATRAAAVGGQAEPIPATPPPPSPTAQSDPAPQPERMTLKPLGYAQKANGLVEAIVNDGDSVQVVHVGDVYKERFTVAEISPDAVELVAVLPQPNASPASSAVASNPKPSVQAEPEAARVSSLGRAGSQVEQPVQTVASLSDSASKPLGYVEESDGTRLAVVADGESVRVVRPQTALADQIKPKPGPRPVEVASGPEPASTGPTIAKLNGSNAGSSVARHGQEPIRLPSSPSARAFQARSGRNLKSRQMLPDQPRSPSIEPDHQARPIVASNTLGYVEKADGKIQAVLDEGEEVRLVQVREPPTHLLVARASPANPAETVDVPSALAALSNGRLAEAVNRHTPVPQISLAGGERLSPLPGQNASADVPEESARAEPPELRGPPDKPPPTFAASVPGNEASSETPPREAPVIASSGSEPARGDSSRPPPDSDASGIAAPRDVLASPEISAWKALWTPGAVSLEGDATALKSPGTTELPDGRASPSPGRSPPGEGARASPEIKPGDIPSLGYVEREGHTLAVVDDGEGGVRLLHEGDLIDDRFRVVKIHPESVEIAELALVSSLVESSPALSVFLREAAMDGVRLPEVPRQAHEGTQGMLPPLLRLGQELPLLGSAKDPTHRQGLNASAQAPETRLKIQPLLGNLSLSDGDPQVSSIKLSPISPGRIRSLGAFPASAPNRDGLAALDLALRDFGEFCPGGHSSLAYGLANGARSFSAASASSARADWPNWFPRGAATAGSFRP